LTYLCLTDRLALEIVTPFNALELFSLVDANRDHLREYLPWVDATKSSDDSASFIKGALKRFAEARELTYFIKQDGCIIGIISLWLEYPDTNTHEIGYWLAKSHTNQGIMTHCVARLLEMAFSSLQAKKVQISCATTNTASNRLAQKAGMKLEGLIRNVEKVNDSIYDHHVYGILEAEYRKMAQTSASS